MSVTVRRAESLAGDVSPLKCSAGERSGGGVRSEPAKNVREKLHKVILCFTHLLPPSPSHSKYGFPIPSLSDPFSALSSSSSCLVVILALAICFPAHHTRRQRELGEEDGALKKKKRAQVKKGETGMIQNMLPLTFPDSPGPRLRAALTEISHIKDVEFWTS